MSDPTEATRPVPARRRLLFEGPMFWIGLIVVGIALAGALSFLPARGDVASAKPDVEAFCAQVDVLGSTDLMSLIVGVTAGPIPLLPGASTTASGDPSTTESSALDQLEAFDQELGSLERVAPHEVRTDVHEVRLAVDDVLTSLRQTEASGIPPSSLLFRLSDAQSQMQQSIERMATFTKDTCGIDLRGPSRGSGLFNN